MNSFSVNAMATNGSFFIDPLELYDDVILNNSVSSIVDDPIEGDKIVRNVIIHRQMVHEFVDVSEPITFLAYNQFYRNVPASLNSADSIIGLVSEAYFQIEYQLLQLLDEPVEVAEVEAGAVKSALSLIGDLQSFNIAPPAISWHGGDAVVMLWGLGLTTYAITVTDGEVGYVVRHDKKAVKMEDSIKLNAFRLADLR